MAFFLRLGALEAATVRAAMESILAQAVFEVRYRRGMVFLDKCGSTMVALEDDLAGDGLVGAGAPGMEYGELVCHTDQIFVRYGPKTTSVVQHWAKRPTRVEVVAPKAWAVVSRSLGVERQVLRAGARFMFQWPVDSVADGWSRIQHLIQPAAPLRELFGPPSRGSIVSVSDRLRSSIDVMEQRLGPGTAPSLKQIVSRFVLQLDLDFAHHEAAQPFTLETDEDATFALGPGQAKDFFRDSWNRARDLSERFAKLVTTP